MSPRASLRFVMRPMSVDDIDTVADWLHDIEDLSLFDRSLPVPLGKEAARERWKADFSQPTFPTAYWFVVEGLDRTPVAVGGLQSINYVHGDAVLPILVAKPERDRGLGLRIAVVLLDVAFDRLRLRRVTTFFRSDNARSTRLTQRVGFREEGRLREAWFAGGRYFDCMVVGLLREEWQARRDALVAELDGAVEVTLGNGQAGREPAPASDTRARPATTRA